jgi:hypothetical protein
MKEVFVIDGKDDHEVEVQLKDTRRRMDREKTNAPVIFLLKKIFSQLHACRQSLCCSSPFYHTPS